MLRLEPLADKLILKTQTTFRKKMNIMTGLMALHESLHETKKKNEVGIILKLNFEKAYDKVNWTFLFDSFKIRGFSDKWCDWIMMVVTRVTNSVKMDDKMV